MKRISLLSSTSETKKTKYDEHYAAETLRKMFDEKISSDYVLVSGNDAQKFETHRSILAATSEFFAALFKSNFADSEKKEYIVNNVDGKTLKKIVDCCYSGHIELDGQCTPEIIRVANYLRFTHIEAKCEQFMMNLLCGRTCVAIYNLAEQYSYQNLKTKSFEIICKEFKQISESDLQQMDKLLLVNVLKSNAIEAPEYIVFNKMKEWVEGNDEERSKYVPELMYYIQLNRIDGNFLLDTIQVFCDKHDCGQMLKNEFRNRIVRPITISAQRSCPMPSDPYDLIEALARRTLDEVFST